MAGGLRLSLTRAAAWADSAADGDEAELTGFSTAAPASLSLTEVFRALAIATKKWFSTRWISRWVMLALGR